VSGNEVHSPINDLQDSEKNCGVSQSGFELLMSISKDLLNCPRLGGASDFKKSLNDENSFLEAKIRSILLPEVVAMVEKGKLGNLDAWDDLPRVTLDQIKTDKRAGLYGIRVSPPGDRQYLYVGMTVCDGGFKGRIGIQHANPKNRERTDKALYKVWKDNDDAEFFILGTIENRKDRKQKRLLEFVEGFIILASKAYDKDARNGQSYWEICQKHLWTYPESDHGKNRLYGWEGISTQDLKAYWAQFSAEERKEKTWPMIQAHWFVPETRAHYIEIASKSAKAQMVEQWKDPEFHARISKSNKDRMSAPEARARQSKYSKERWSNPEFKARMSVALKERYKDPETHARVAKQLREIQQTPANRARSSKRAIEMWKKPETKVNIMAGHKKWIEGLTEEELTEFYARRANSTYETRMSKAAKLWTSEGMTVGLAKQTKTHIPFKAEKPRQLVFDFHTRVVSSLYVRSHHTLTNPLSSMMYRSECSDPKGRHQLSQQYMQASLMNKGPDFLIIMIFKMSQILIKSPNFDWMLPHVMAP